MTSRLPVSSASRSAGATRLLADRAAARDLHPRRRGHLDLRGLPRGHRPAAPRPGRRPRAGDRRGGPLDDPLEGRPVGLRNVRGVRDRQPGGVRRLSIGSFPNTWLRGGDEYTQVGDWPWLRPSMAVVPDGARPMRATTSATSTSSAPASPGLSCFAPAYPSNSEPRLADWEDHRAQDLPAASRCSVIESWRCRVIPLRHSRSTDRSSTSSGSARIRWSPSPRRNGSGPPDPGTRPVEIDRSTPGTACSVGSRGGSRWRSSSTG